MTSGEAPYPLEKLITRKVKIASANGLVSYRVFLGVFVGLHAM